MAFGVYSKRELFWSNNGAERIGSAKCVAKSLFLEAGEMRVEMFVGKYVCDLGRGNIYRKEFVNFVQNGTISDHRNLFPEK